MFNEQKKFPRKKRPSISDFNKYLINTIDNQENQDKKNNSFTIFSRNPLNPIKPFNNPNKKLLLEKLDTSNYHKNKKVKKEDKSFNNINNYDNSEDLFSAKKLTSSFLSERNYINNNIYYPKKVNDKYKNNNKTEIEINLINNNTKEKTSSTFDNDIIEASPLEIYNRKMEYLSFVIKIQSFWRKYNTYKKFKFYKFVFLINKIIHKYYIINMKLFFTNLANGQLISSKIYYKKNIEKNIIKRNIKLYVIKPYYHKSLKSENNIDENYTQNKNKSTNHKRVKTTNWWIKLPIILEKYIKKKVFDLYINHFFENLKLKEKEVLKQKQNKLLYKLINLNEMKNLKKYMNIYKEKISNKKQNKTVYYSLIKPKLTKRNNKKIFDFQTCYKENILGDIIKKYGYTSIIQKYYLLWKKKSGTNIKSRNKRKKIIKIKKVKNNNDKNNEIYNTKEDVLNNVSEISQNMSYSSNTLNSIQSLSRMNICFTTTNKKMRVKKITVDKNYYKIIENNNNYNI